MKAIFFFAVVIAFASCSAKPDKHELLYNSTADSLRKYEHDLQDLGINDECKDYMKLSYSDFKSKYNMTDSDMDAFAKTYEVTYNIAATMRAIDENMKLVEGIEIDTNAVGEE